MTNKRILITGGSGDLGRVLSERAVAAGHAVTVTYLTRPERVRAGVAIPLDLTDGSRVQEVIAQVQPEVIIHTALNQGVRDPRQQIVSAAYHVARAAEKGTLLIYLSSDMVFDGLNAPYADDDPPSPRSPYGQAKAEMEMMADHVVRTSLIYDFERGNKQIDWMLDKIERGEKVKLFNDEYRSPIWVVNLADALLELMNVPIKGVLNVAGPQSMSRLELGRGLLQALGYVPEQHIEVASLGDSGRQPNLTLDVHKAAMLLKTPLLTFEQAVAQWREQHSPNNTDNTNSDPTEKHRTTH
jgi:dTDP-4-dehydrorhamnose reductase